MNFTRVEERIINRIQEDIPLVREPFRVIAEELSLPVTDFLETLSSLKRKRIVRNISAIFNADRLGYRTSLVAFAVPQEKVEKAALRINEHPGVSHNYLRDHRYNLWFTLAVERTVSLEKTAEILAARCDAYDHLILVNERLVKIGFMLKIGEDEEDDEVPHGPGAAAPHPEFREIPRRVQQAILMLQTDLPIVLRPFYKVAEGAGSEMGEDEILAVGADLKQGGIMRRYAAVLKHYNAGYRANAMTAWKPGKSEEEHALSVFKGSRHISHLYYRTVHPGKWEYPLFAMIHARSDEELDEIIRSLKDRSGIGDFLVLKSLKEYKKKRVTYFSPDFDKWNRENL